MAWPLALALAPHGAISIDDKLFVTAPGAAGAMVTVSILADCDGDGVPDPALSKGGCKSPLATKQIQLNAAGTAIGPFSLAELNARVRAVLARATRGGADNTLPPMVLGELVIDFASRRVLKRGETLQLTPTEYRLLAALAESAGRTLSHEQLLEKVWGSGYAEEAGYVKRYIWYLRQKVEDDPSLPTYVETVRGFGYRLAR